MNRKVAITTAALVLPLTLAALSADAQQAGPGRLLPVLANLLAQYDTNADGAVTQAEINDTRANRLKQFDRNTDGKLSLEEYQALWLDAYRRQMVDQFQRHDDDGDGAVTVEEFNEDFANLVRRNDANGDGKVDAQDVRRPAPPAAQIAPPGNGLRPQAPLQRGQPNRDVRRN